MATSIPPRWLISNDYGFDLNQLNWQLKRKVVPKKDAKTKGPTWKVVGYYPTLQLLAEGLQNHILLGDTIDLSFEEHMERALTTIENALKALKTHMVDLGIGLATKPPGYVKFK
ncbi:MAG: hypothetical protein DRI98_08565 [Bacteroidetes bacterium]|nr:MAG: hypothetical protein DRI98_08565 [Bacteroidota bacterium]